MPVANMSAPAILAAAKAVTASGGVRSESTGVVEDEEVRGEEAHAEIPQCRRAHRHRDHVGGGGGDAGAEHRDHQED